MKEALKKSRFALISYIVARSYWNRLRFRSGKIHSAGGATTVHRPLEESVGYIRHQLDDWIRYAGMTPEFLAGKRVVEFGPGDNVGVSLRMLALGAAEAVCMDKYYAPRDTERERRIYLRIREELNEGERERFDEAVELEQAVRFNEKRIRIVYGTGAEEADQALPASSVDIVFSRAVLECVDTEKCFAAMDRILKPGGIAAHKIDLRDYGIFSGNGYHPLEFLTIPAWVYSQMARDTDRPKRHHLNYYRSKCVEYGWAAEFYRCGVIAEGGVSRDLASYVKDLQKGVHYTDADIELTRRIRPRLDAAYGDLSDEDLLTSSLFLVATKPCAARTGAAGAN
jgi:SAM-dependent methyltransferase